ncbi:MAG TPA: hypothetical protein VII45_09825, partial [Solirubrobacterales bacterium]
MSLRDIDGALIRANPIGRASVARLPLTGAEDSLLGAIVNEPMPSSPVSRRSPRGSRRYGRYALALIGTATALAVALLIFDGSGSGPAPQPAFAAAAVKVAEANPRLLVTAPGWSIKDAYGFEVDSGSMVFGNGTYHLTLNWYPARFYRSYLRDRRKVSAVVHSTIFGHRATTVRYHRSVVNEPGLDYETLFSPWGEVAVGIRGIVASKREYQAILNSLRRVGVNTWLNAMPPEVVQPAALDATVEQMLRGVRLPANFDRSTLPNPSLITDRYRLGTAVTGAVTCGWLEDWVAAARNDDHTTAREAVDGLGSARHWPVLLSMVHEKGWKGTQLPQHGNGWAPTILELAREI